MDYAGTSSPVFQLMADGMVRWGMLTTGISKERSIPAIGSSAHDVRSGKLEWELGGPGATRQANTFFLGPPLPLMGQLYVLADVKGEVHLLALNAATGDLVWSQPMASPPLSIVKDRLRRWAGMSPVYADGILVCPTYSGAIVGYDLATRSFLWGYRYTEKASQTD